MRSRGDLKVTRYMVHAECSWPETPAAEISSGDNLHASRILVTDLLTGYPILHALDSMRNAGRPPHTHTHPRPPVCGVFYPPENATYPAPPQSQDSLSLDFPSS